MEQCSKLWGIFNCMTFIILGFVVEFLELFIKYFI